jgi:predicted CopG family antitoxin
MKRTQIYIDEKAYNFLEKESHAENKSMSELIRESLREKMERRTEAILKRTENVFGIWRDKKINVEGYIRNIRRDRKL